METLNIPSRTLGQLLLPGFCPRCFWIALRCEGKLPYQIPFPGIFSSIDAYGKDIIHDYFDRNRKLPDWSRFRYEDPATRIVLRGTPDDIFRLPDGTHHIVDYKTAKATKTQDELFPLYLVQLNVYGFIGNLRGDFPTTALSLIYVEPQTDIPSTEFDLVMSDSGFALNFTATRKKVELKAKSLIPELLERARGIYERSKPPVGADGCKNCILIERFVNFAGSSGA
jgi:hypothetical protein